MRRTRSVLLITVHILTLHVFAQPRYFRHYQVEDGLSTNTVITAIQDKYGFLWLGTSEGLNRFDGNAFKIYRHQPENARSLGSNAIYCLYEDQNQLIWVGTEKGIYRYNPESDDFDNPLPIPPRTVRSICQDKQGLIWFILENLLYCYESASGKLIRKYIPGIQECTVLYPDKRQGIWIGTSDSKLVHLTHERATLYPIAASGQNSVEAICGFRENQLLIGCSKEGLLAMDISQKTFRNLLQDHQGKHQVFVRNILPVNDSTIYVSSENGLYIYNWNRHHFQHLQKSLLNPFSLSDNALYALCQDREGGIWIGSYFGGVNYLPHTPIQFEKFIPGPNDNSLSGSAIREIVAGPNGKLWIGSEDGGLSSYDPVNNQFEKFKPNAKNRLSSSNIHGMLAIGSRLLIGTFENGLDIMDLKQKKVIENFKAGPGKYELKSNFITKIFRSSGGTILLCTAHGMFRFDMARKQFYPLKSLPRNIFYSAIAEDSSGTIWIGTHNRGVYYMNQQDTGKLMLPNDSNEQLENTRILYLMPDTDNHLWICTINGLFNVIPFKKTHDYYGFQPNGLPGDLVYSIIKDIQGNYWIPGSRGLTYLNAGTKKFKVFRQNNGLLNNQFNYQSVYQDAEGQIYLGSIKGLIKFNPGRMDTTHLTPPVFLTHLQYPGNHTRSGPEATVNIPLLTTKKIVLKHDQSSFNIDFTAIHFTDPVNIFFAYKINDGSWYPLGNSRQIAFNNQPPGIYTISVRSTNTAGEWMNNARQLVIEIRPRFWESPLAYALYTVTALLLISLVFLYYTQRQRERQQINMERFTLKKEKELYHAKMNFFSEITHEIKTPITLIKLPLEHLTQTLTNQPDLQPYLKIMNNNTIRLLELTQQLLDFRKIETEHFNISITRLDLSKVLPETVQGFQPVIDRKEIHIRLERPELPVYIETDREALRKILNNLLDNAIKYCDRFISIDLKNPSSASTVTITIENDGAVVPDSFHERMFQPFFRNAGSHIAGSGLGLSMVKALTDLLGGQISYQNSNQRNKIQLNLPIIYTNINTDAGTNL